MLLITGGTGSFGRTMLKHYATNQLDDVRIFSRDEAKQEELRKTFGSKNIEWVVGDTRDQAAVRKAMRGIRHVFHAAALKQVPSCELNPSEAVKTNILGSENILTAATELGVKAVVVLSTDKAVYPVNAMGISKAMMERLATAAAKTSDTRIMVTRYGNVLMSRGSVVPLFIDQIRKGRITITDPEMTRFLMTLEQSVALVLEAFHRGRSGDILVRKAPATTIAQLAAALVEIFCLDPEVRIIGARHGEKKHEALLSAEEMARAEDRGDFYAVPSDQRGLDYETETAPIRLTNSYTSGNTRQLTQSQLIDLLLALPEIRSEVER